MYFVFTLHLIICHMNISEPEKEYAWKNDNSDEEKMVDMLATLLAVSSMTTERKTKDSIGSNLMNQMPKGLTNCESRKAEKDMKTEKNDIEQPSGEDQHCLYLVGGRLGHTSDFLMRIRYASDAQETHQ